VIASLLQQIKRDSLLDIRVLQILRLINNHQIFFDTQESTSFLGKKLLVLACSFLDVYVKQKRLNFSMFTAAMTKLREVGDVVKTSSLGRKATVLGVADPCNMKLKLKLKWQEHFFLIHRLLPACGKNYHYVIFQKQWIILV